MQCKPKLYRNLRLPFKQSLAIDHFHGVIGNCCTMISDNVVTKCATALEKTTFTLRPLSDRVAWKSKIF